MLSLTGNLRIFLSLESCDTRKSFDGLFNEVVLRLGGDPCSGSLYVFSNRSRTIVKMLHWDGTGLQEPHSPRPTNQASSPVPGSTS